MLILNVSYPLRGLLVEFIEWHQRLGSCLKCRADRIYTESLNARAQPITAWFDGVFWPL